MASSSLTPPPKVGLKKLKQLLLKKKSLNPFESENMAQLSRYYTTSTSPKKHYYTRQSRLKTNDINLSRSIWTTTKTKDDIVPGSYNYQKRKRIDELYQASHLYPSPITHTSTSSPCNIKKHKQENSQLNNTITMAGDTTIPRLSLDKSDKEESDNDNSNNNNNNNNNHCQVEKENNFDYTTLENQYKINHALVTMDKDGWLPKEIIMSILRLLIKQAAKTPQVSKHGEIQVLYQIVQWLQRMNDKLEKDKKEQEHAEQYHILTQDVLKVRILRESNELIYNSYTKMEKENMLEKKDLRSLGVHNVYTINYILSRYSKMK